MNKYENISVSQIKNEIKNNDLNNQIKMIDDLLIDNRKGVNDLAKIIIKKNKKYNEELIRLKKMNFYENELRKKNIKIIAGMDEVGRGPLAGPVVVCAVILPENYTYIGINDSKKVSKKNRERLYEEIINTALDYSFGEASCEEIDYYNILNATKIAMKRAINGLNINPEYLLIDAVKLDDINIRQNSIIKGDEKSVSIAAASILAKVRRDSLMVEYSKEYPGYGFENNKGYGTSEHYDGLNKLSFSEIHRKTFIRDFL